MYCSTCGVVVTENLSYCNHCGARIVTANSDKNAYTDVKPGLLVSAMSGTFILGLVAISILLGVMKSVLGLDPGQLLGFATLSFLILLLLEGTFMFLLFRRKRGEGRPRTESLAEHATKELDTPQPQALPEPLSSVTDHTTRTFEPIYTKRNKVN